MTPVLVWPDVTLSVCLVISWPPHELVDRAAEFTSTGETLHTLIDIFEGLGHQKSVIVARSRMEDGRFVGWLSFIDVLTAQTVIAEAGADLSAFPSEKQFASWLGLCPSNEQSGGKILNRRTRKVVNRASVAFRNAASTLLRSQSYLGAQYRRLRTRLGAPKAITAMARKLACLFYRLIKHGQQYVDKGNEYYESKYREQQIRSLTKKAQRLGLQLVGQEMMPA